MNTIGNFFADHWRKLAGIAVGALCAIPVLTPFALPIVGLGGLIFGSDFQVGATVGTPLGAGAKDVVNHRTLTAEELQTLADAARRAGLLPAK